MSFDEVEVLDEPRPAALNFLTQLKGRSIGRLHVIRGFFRYPRSSQRLEGITWWNGWGHFRPQRSQGFFPWP